MDIQNKARRLAKTLKRKNKRMSWRVMSREMFGGVVNYATLCRIATTDGEYIPQDEKILIALGLKRAPRAQVCKHTPLHEMCSAALLKALNNREEFPNPDRRVLNAFVRAGLLKRSWVTR